MTVYATRKKKPSWFIYPRKPEGRVTTNQRNAIVRRDTKMGKGKQPKKRKTNLAREKRCRDGEGKQPKIENKPG